MIGGHRSPEVDGCAIIDVPGAADEVLHGEPDGGFIITIRHAAGRGSIRGDRFDAQVRNGARPWKLDVCVPIEGEATAIGIDENALAFEEQVCLFVAEVSASHGSA